MAVPSEKSFKRIASNRKALRDYSVLDRFEAGIELYGTEVKSLREAQVNLTGSYASVDDGQVFVHNVNIKPYEFGNRFNHEAARPRRLLLHRREIVLLRRQAEQKGLALIPMSLYFKRGRVKVELAVCRGKRVVDKRETIRRRTADREAERAMRRVS
jgi:SsrA-binding protein